MNGDHAWWQQEPRVAVDLVPRGRIILGVSVCGTTHRGLLVLGLRILGLRVQDVVGSVRCLGCWVSIQGNSGSVFLQH